MSGNKKIETFPETSLLRVWRRPTFPQFNAVSSARRGLTSLFGMGRGGPPCCSHHVSLSRLSCLNLDMALKESAGKTSTRIWLSLFVFLTPRRTAGSAVIRTLSVKCSGY